jgi:hypothetical protein
MATDYTVRVDSKNHRITVYPESESVWVAVGQYFRSQIEVKGASEAEVVDLWVEAARRSLAR